MNDLFRMESANPQLPSSHDAKVSKLEEAKPFLRSKYFQKPKVNQQHELDSEIQPAKESQARQLAHMLGQEISAKVKVNRNDLELQTLPMEEPGKSVHDPDAIEKTSSPADNDSTTQPKSCKEHMKFTIVEVLVFLVLNMFLPGFDVISDVNFIRQLWDILPIYGKIGLGILAIPSVVALFLAITNFRHLGNKKRRFLTLKCRLICQ